MTIAALESLSFGLGRMVEAAAGAGHRLCLLTGDRSVYRHELATLPADALDVVDVDTFDDRAVGAALERLPGLAGLINTTDTWSVPAAEHAARHGLAGPDPGSVRLVRDKAWVRQALHRAGLSRGTAVRVRAGRESAGEILEAVGLPAVLKASAGTSSRDVWIVHDEPALAAALGQARERALAGELFAEPFLAGPLYSAETLTWEGTTRLLGVSSRQTSRLPDVREEAAAFPVALPDAELEALGHWVGRVLSTAGHDSGFAHVEFVLTRWGPELVEVNRRIGGALVGEAMCRSLNTNVYEAVIDIALGRKPPLLERALKADGPAVGFVLVYPDQPGHLDGWEGLDGLADFPGAVRWYPTRVAGELVEHVRDQRGCTGMVMAEAATAELALHRAWSAAVTVRPVVKAIGGA